MSSSFDFFSPSVFFWNSPFDWSSLRIRQFEVWTFLKISKNSFRKFKPIIQSNPRRHKHELNNALYEAWNINLFEKKSVRQNEPSKTKFCNSLLSLKIRKKIPFGRTNPQKRNFVIRCCPWIYKNGGVRRGLLVLSLNAALLSVSCVRRGLWEDYWKNSLKQNSIFQIVLSQPSPYTLRCCQCGI